MPEAGGPTTQSGILFQNSVAALFLGRLLDTTERLDSDCIAKVRVEAPTSVDDIVVQYADGHRTYVQAKEDVRLRGYEGSSLWRNLGQQYNNIGFQHGTDSLLLYFGSIRDDFYLLREICRRASTSQSVTEWKNRLSKNQVSLLDSISASLNDVLPTEGQLLSFCRHVEVEIASLEMIERDLLPQWMPQTNRSDREIFRLLRDRVSGQGRVRGIFEAHSLRESILAEAKDIVFDYPPDIARLREEVMKCGSVFPLITNSFGPSKVHVERDVTQRVVDWLLSEGEVGLDNNVAMLVDQAGMGKSVVMVDILSKLRSRDVAVLAIKADIQLTGITNLAEIQQRLYLRYSAEATLQRLAAIERVVILIDQIDALSLSLAHDQSSLSVTLDFVARIRQLANVRILLSCRRYDKESDPRLAVLKSMREFSVGELTREEVHYVLARYNIEYSHLPDTTIGLLRTPLHLDLFLRTAFDIAQEQLDSINSLQQLYANIWNHVILKAAPIPSQNHRIEVLANLTKYMNVNNQITVPTDVLAKLNSPELEFAADWLASVGILIRHTHQWAFLHQTFFDYCYARFFVMNGGDLAEEIKKSSQGLSERQKLVQVISYLRNTNPRSYFSNLQSLLFDLSIRFHLRQALIQWFGTLQNPTEEERQIGRKLLSNEFYKPIFLAAIAGNSGWFKWMRERVGVWLTSGNISSINEAVAYLRSLVHAEQKEVAIALSPFLNRSDEWNERINWVIQAIQAWIAEEAVEIYEILVKESEVLAERISVHQLKDVAKAFPNTALSDPHCQDHRSAELRYQVVFIK